MRGGVLGVKVLVSIGLKINPGKRPQEQEFSFKLDSDEWKDSPGFNVKDVLSLDRLSYIQESFHHSLDIYCHFITSRFTTVFEDPSLEAMDVDEAIEEDECPLT